MYHYNETRKKFDEFVNEKNKEKFDYACYKLINPCKVILLNSSKFSPKEELTTNIWDIILNFLPRDNLNKVFFFIKDKLTIELKKGLSVVEVKYIDNKLSGKVSYKSDNNGDIKGDCSFKELALENIDNPPQIQLQNNQKALLTKKTRCIYYTAKL